MPDWIQDIKVLAEARAAIMAVPSQSNPLSSSSYPQVPQSVMSIDSAIGTAAQGYASELQRVTPDSVSSTVSWQVRQALEEYDRKKAAENDK